MSSYHPMVGFMEESMKPSFRFEVWGPYTLVRTPKIDEPTKWKSTKREWWEANNPLREIWVGSQKIHKPPAVLVASTLILSLCRQTFLTNSNKNCLDHLVSWRNFTTGFSLWILLFIILIIWGLYIPSIFHVMIFTGNKMKKRQNSQGRPDGRVLARLYYYKSYLHYTNSIRFRPRFLSQITQFMLVFLQISCLNS